jgi:2-keto-4-pentenoate hydratase/2-oxohepta-3-ene-1,7-dioic acid hydratase in catechol pathway
MTLNDGDIIMTGTPAGVGKVIAGDVFKAHLLREDEPIVEGLWLAI